MAFRKEAGLVPSRLLRDPFAMMRDMTSEFDRLFGDWPFFRRPELRERTASEIAWYPRVDVFEKDNRLVTKIDLPGMKKEDVKVEVTDGHLIITGERKHEAEEKNEGFYRREREYGSFYRTVPLPEGAGVDDVRATFADGVLEVSVPLPPRAEKTPRTVEIQDAKGSRAAA